MTRGRVAVLTIALMLHCVSVTAATQGSLDDLSVYKLQAFASYCSAFVSIYSSSRISYLQGLADHLPQAEFNECIHKEANKQKFVLEKEFEASLEAAPWKKELPAAQADVVRKFLMSAHSVGFYKGCLAGWHDGGRWLRRISQNGFPELTELKQQECDTLRFEAYNYADGIPLPVSITKPVLDRLENAIRSTAQAQTSSP